jgi:hypothetical protein
VDNSERRTAAVQGLVAHWLSAPNASDTVEGILLWWLPGRGLSEREVAQALAWLTERGVVVSAQAADRKVRYRLVDPSGRGLRELLD